MNGRFHFSRPGRTSAPAAVAEFRVLAVCSPGEFEGRLRQAARNLGQEISFARTFGSALAMVRLRFYDLLVLAKIRDGMLARDFVREIKRRSEDAVIVLAAPHSAYEDLIEVLVEGAYDFLPDDADDHQLRLMLGRAMEHARLRRRRDELERALDTQTASLRRRVQELAFLNDMAQDMGAVPELDEILDRALRRTLDAFGCRCGSFLLADPESGELVVRSAAGTGADELVGARRRIGEGIAGKVARDGHPVLVPDIDRDSRFRADALGAASCRHYRTRSFVAVPLVHRGRVLGELNLTEKASGEPFTQDDLRLLSVLAGHIASAVSGALAADELRRANDALRRRMTSTRQHLRAADEQRTRTETLARAITSRLPAAVAAFDADLRITFANDAATRLLGLEPGRSLKGHPARSDLALLADAAVEVLDHGKTKTLVCGAERGGRSSRKCLTVVAAPLHLPGGAVAGGTLVATPRRCPALTPWNRDDQ